MTSTYGKTRVEITDKNGKRTTVWKGRQTQLAEAATNRQGMIPQLQRGADGRVETVSQGGEVVAIYERPGLGDTDAALRYVAIYLERERIWARAKSSHEGPIRNEQTGRDEFWLLGVRASSREHWEAMKKVPPKAFVAENWYRINHARDTG